MNLPSYLNELGVDESGGRFGVGPAGYDGRMVPSGPINKSKSLQPLQPNFRGELKI